MSKHLGTYSASNGVVSSLHEEDGKFILHHHQPGKVNEAVLVAVRRRRSMGQNPKAKARMEASIPTLLHHEWREEWKKGPCNTVSWPNWVAIKCNDRDYKRLRYDDSRKMDIIK